MRVPGVAAAQVGHPELQPGQLGRALLHLPLRIAASCRVIPYLPASRSTVAVVTPRGADGSSSKDR